MPSHERKYACEYAIEDNSIPRRRKGKGRFTCPVSLRRSGSRYTLGCQPEDKQKCAEIWAETMMNQVDIGSGSLGEERGHVGSDVQKDYEDTRDF